MDKAEAAAKIIIETLIPGARMHYRQSQSSGEHDFDLEHATGMQVPLEVTVSTDEVAEATEAALLHPRRGRWLAPRVHSRHDWSVCPTRHVKINKAYSRVDSYLAAIEAEGRERFSASTDAAESPAVFAILKDLAIEYGNVTTLKSPGIQIMPPADGGLVDVELVNDAVEVEALKTDNKRKLSAAKGSERHLFVYVATTRHVVWAAVRDEDPPLIGPRLPPEMTDVWVASGDDGWHTVWHAKHGLTWTHMGLVNIKTGERQMV